MPLGSGVLQHQRRDEATSDRCIAKAHTPIKDFVGEPPFKAAKHTHMKRKRSGRRAPIGFLAGRQIHNHWTPAGAMMGHAAVLKRWGCHEF